MMSNDIFPPGEPPAAAQPATEQLKAWEQLDALVGIFEEHIENVEFMRRMRGGLADNEAEMPATNLFKAELEVMRRCVSSLHPPASALTITKQFFCHKTGCCVGSGRCNWRDGDEAECSCGLADLIKASDVVSPTQLAQAPTTWMVTRDSFERPEFFDTEAEANANACLGVCDTHVVPLYRESSAVSPTLSQIKSIVEHEECSDPENCTEQHPREMCVRCRIRLLLAVVSPREEPK